MLKFIVGVFVGAIIGFFTCAICSMARTDDSIEIQYTKKAGEKDAGR